MLLIISGPSGVGKTTITHQVEKRLNGIFSVSVTTRPQTEADVEGQDYYFVDRDAFHAREHRGEMLEWAEVFGHCYGTPRRPVEMALDAGRLVIVEIDVAGAIQIKAKRPDTFALFILPPDEETLLDRLRNRQREGEDIIQKRFAKAKDEIAQAHTARIYDRFIVNDDLNRAIEEAVSQVRQEQAARASGPLA